MIRGIVLSAIAASTRACRAGARPGWLTGLLLACHEAVRAARRSVSKQALVSTAVKGHALPARPATALGLLAACEA